jgi:hypothetical protein
MARARARARPARVERTHPHLAFGVRLVELPTLDVDRPAGEEVIAAAVIGVQVCVDDHVDAGEIEVLAALMTGDGDPYVHVIDHPDARVLGCAVIGGTSPGCRGP